MKNLYLIPCLLFLFSCNKSKSVFVPAEVPVKKLVEYRIFAVRDYSAPDFAKTTAEIHLGIGATSHESGQSKLIWDSIISPRNISTFPLEDLPIIIRKDLTVIESKEDAIVSYWIRYVTGTYVGDRAAGEYFQSGQIEKKMDVAL